ncbi:MAG: pantoate--beta-alanine ligase [Gammaproteobacteria bacterium]
MPLLHSVAELRAAVRPWRQRGERIALVPTMGNLHAGHLKLVEEAHARAQRVVVSVFVNPLQFGPSEDFRSYPRTREADRQKLQEARADLLFAPSVKEMYPHGQGEVTRVTVPGLSEILEGESRPGHFSGVATVVTKLFNIAQPDVALFGKKDYQQLLVIRRLADDLSLPIEIVDVPTMREADGLALSSRNQYLTAAEHEQAPLLHATLEKTVAAVRQGQRNFESLEAHAIQALSVCMRPDYVAIRDAQTLARPQAEASGVVVLAAAWLGKARLIDNIDFSL